MLGNLTCQNCKKPIPFESERCPVCGISLKPILALTNPETIQVGGLYSYTGEIENLREKRFRIVFSIGIYILATFLTLTLLSVFSFIRPERPIININFTVIKNINIKEIPQAMVEKTKKAIIESREGVLKKILLGGVFFMGSLFMMKFISFFLSSYLFFPPLINLFVAGLFASTLIHFGTLNLQNNYQEKKLLFELKLGENPYKLPIFSFPCQPMENLSRKIWMVLGRPNF